MGTTPGTTKSSDCGPQSYILIYGIVSVLLPTTASNNLIYALNLDKLRYCIFITCETSIVIGAFLNPKNDLAFKRIFGSEKNKDILIHFLNDIFGRTTNSIEKVTILTPTLDPEIASLRSSAVDVMCEDTEGNKFIVEMQVRDELGFAKRAQYYAAKTYIEQRDKGIKYKDLKEVVFLAITSFMLFPETAAYLSHHKILDTVTYENHLKDFSFSFLELPKFQKTKEQLVTMTEKWSYFFKYATQTDPDDLPMIIGSDNIMQKAYDELNRFSWTVEELRAYDSVDRKQQSEEACLEAAEQKGEKRGEANFLIMLLEQKFGPLPTQIRERVNCANSNQLRVWGKRIFEVNNILDLFEESSTLTTVEMV